MKLITYLFCIFLFSFACAEEIEAIDDRGLLNLSKDFWNKIIAQPLNTLTSSVAALLAQVVAGVAIDGVGAIGIGKRQNAITSWFQDLGKQIVSSIYPSVNSIVQDFALQLTIALANFANGKRDAEESERFIVGLIDKFAKPIANLILKPLGNIAINGILPIIG